MVPSTQQAAAAIVLTGGASSRMGRHKPGIAVGGSPIVARVLAAVSAMPTVVVGRGDGVLAGVPVVMEEPPGGGPVAGIAAGWAALQEVPYAAEPGPSAPEVVVVLAGDLPLLTPAHVDALVEAVRSARPEERVAVTVSSSGPNWLCAAWPSRLLASRLGAVGGPAGVSVRGLLGDVARVEVPDSGDVAVDVDTPEELEAVRRRVGDS